MDFTSDIFFVPFGNGVLDINSENLVDYYLKSRIFLTKFQNLFKKVTHSKMPAIAFDGLIVLKKSGIAIGIS